MKEFRVKVGGGLGCGCGFLGLGREEDSCERTPRAHFCKVGIKNRGLG